MGTVSGHQALATLGILAERLDIDDFSASPMPMPPSLGRDATKPETVNHPKHYNKHPSGVECIDIVEHYNFNLGNAIKYIWRAGLKSDNPVEDLKKAAWYVNREIERIANHQPATSYPKIGDIYNINTTGSKRWSGHYRVIQVGEDFASLQSLSTGGVDVMPIALLMSWEKVNSEDK